MNIYSSPTPRSDGTIFHSDFMDYVAVNQEGVKDFLKAVAANAVGRAITLAAVGVSVNSMKMPNMSAKARCCLVLPRDAWVNSLTWVQKQHIRQERFLELTCCQISGAVAEYVFDAFDHYGNLGLEDIEGSHELLSSYEATHNIRRDWVLAGCTHVVERLLGQHFEMAEAMGERLLKQGSLCQPEMEYYLSGVRTEALGRQVLAAFDEPWIEKEAVRVQRMFIGNG